jgi:hypothetical protein
MSILARFSPSSTSTTQQYDEVTSRLEAEGNWPPDGLEYHCAFFADGNIRVSEIWDSREQFEAFGQRLMPLLADAGIDAGQPEILDVHNVIKR